MGWERSVKIGFGKNIDNNGKLSAGGDTNGIYDKI